MASSCSSLSSSASSSPLVDESGVVNKVVASLQTQLRRQQELFIRVKKCEEEIEKLKLGSLHTACGGLLPPPEAQKDSGWKAECEEGAMNVGAEKMCDYCFKLAPCRPCPACEHEWYCSSPCQRLRTHVHRSFCRHRRRVK
ncbi:hypothetical protein TraAM80_06809 [Trypanosoma rangeli]|uniref:MYND-type domain-containing protein n=1 Tax=Trypanosoma rangeli TaxID=5698 RepID=A0A422N8B7_TRYRA|nr:uncharacterized protein TraAM80_06809 [Trypanosoma rangeli]RNF01686.1 hypothetical protein TraAM80_06809 [Trypanosoma rangeli]|eukprot:RNF01686.1 hypothetical protein TraAM80_06809 [Trypanosoma rangeli]